MGSPGRGPLRTVGCQELPAGRGTASPWCHRRNCALLRCHRAEPAAGQDSAFIAWRALWKPGMPRRSGGSYESLFRIAWIQAMPGR